MDLETLPNDIIKKIRKIYFYNYIAPTINIWQPVSQKIYSDFVNIVVRWVRNYLNSFQPNYMKEYIWADYLYIESEDLSQIKWSFQHHFNCVEVCKNKVRLNVKLHMRDMFKMWDISKKDKFEWKPLTLKIDIIKNKAHIEDFEGRFAKYMFSLGPGIDLIEENIIPWFIYVP